MILIAKARLTLVVAFGVVWVVVVLVVDVVELMVFTLDTVELVALADDIREDSELTKFRTTMLSTWAYFRNVVSAMPSVVGIVVAEVSDKLSGRLQFWP